MLPIGEDSAYGADDAERFRRPRPLRERMSFSPISRAFVAAAVLVLGCSEEQTSAKPAASSSAAQARPAAPSAAPSAVAAPVPSPAAPPPNRDDCPEGSSGPGILASPCEAKGTSRQMELSWNNKIDDKGPFFRVASKAKKTILYGKVYVYFYDKAGKQLEVKDEDGKAHPYKQCSGNTIFSGVMAPAEKAVIQFSCVQKKHVPEGTAAIEGEMVMVGFADESGKKNEFYWRNNDIGPEVRPKGGIKK
jgi:hypothetical protein